MMELPLPSRSVRVLSPAMSPAMHWWALVCTELERLSVGRSWGVVVVVVVVVLGNVYNDGA